MIPRFIIRWWIRYQRYEAQCNLDESLIWLGQAPGKINEIRKYIAACDTDLRLMESGGAQRYSARERA